MNEKTVTVRMNGSLFDAVIDGVATDVERMTGENLHRRSEVWTWTKRGRGHVATAKVSETAGRYIAAYLRSRVGLHVAFDDGGKAAFRRSEEVGVQVARDIENQTA